MIAGPEQARLLKEFESQLSGHYDEQDLHHHEQSVSVQELFKKHVCDLYSTIITMGNPFLDDYTDLLVLNTRNCASDDVVRTVKSIKELGLSQYKDYVQNVVISTKTSIHQPIKKNSLPLFKRQKVKENKVKKKLTVSKVMFAYSVIFIFPVPSEVEI